MYEQAVKFIVNTKLEDVFNQRCLEIVNDTTGIGWGLHEIYYEHLSE